MNIRLPKDTNVRSDRFIDPRAFQIARELLPAVKLLNFVNDMIKFKQKEFDTVEKSITSPLCKGQGRVAALAQNESFEDSSPGIMNVFIWK
jgi:hypothetical protein